MRERGILVYRDQARACIATDTVSGMTQASYRSSVIMDHSPETSSAPGERIERLACGHQPGYARQPFAFFLAQTQRGASDIFLEMFD